LLLQVYQLYKQFFIISAFLQLKKWSKSTRHDFFKIKHGIFLNQPTPVSLKKNVNQVFFFRRLENEKKNKKDNQKLSVQR
jgi:hypothetical protein